MVVHRRWRHRLLAVAGQFAHHGGHQVLPPAGDLPRGDRRDPIVPESLDEPILEPSQVPADLPGDFGGADPTDCGALVRVHPELDRLAVLDGHSADGQHLS